MDAFSEYPDELRTDAPATWAGSSALDDFLWETASWDPVVEEFLDEADRDGAGQESAVVAQRLLDARQLTEPSVIARLMRLLAAGQTEPPQTKPPQTDPPRTKPPRNKSSRTKNVQPQPAPTKRAQSTPSRVQPAQTGSLGPDIDPLGTGTGLFGRELERDLVQRWASRPGGLSVVCITGPAGIGKTRLARAAVDGAASGRTTRALRVTLGRPAFGTGDRMLAATPYAALAELLVQLGVAEADIPAALDDRQVRYAAEIVGRDPIIFLDGVLHEDQVVPLLPAKGLVILTSRAALAGLSSPYVQRVPLGPLPAAEAGRLAAAVLGAGADNGAAATVAEWCQGMPGPTLLLSRWVARTALAEGVAPEAVVQRLAVFRRAGDSAQDLVDVVLSLLSADQRAVLATLAVLRLPQIDLATTVLATGLSRDQVTAAVGRLTELGLVAATDGGLSIASVAADWARAHAAVAGRLTEEAYKRLLEPVIGLHTLRVQALRDLMATPGRKTAAARDWTLAQCRAGQAELAAILVAVASGPDPTAGRGLAAAYLDAAPAAETAGGWPATRDCITAARNIARAAGDEALTDRALTWLEGHDRRLQPFGPERAEPVQQPVADSLPAEPSPVRIETALQDIVSAAPDQPVMFGAGIRPS